VATGSSTLVEVNSDGGLVLGTLAGDRATFAAMYDRFAPPIYDLLLTLHRDPKQAAAATYETFQRAIADLNHLGDPTKLRPWLYTLVYREAKKGGKNDSLGAVAGTGAGDAPLPDPQAPLWQAVGELDQLERALLTLHLRHGLDHAEIASIVGLSIKRTRDRLDKLRARLDPMLRPFLEASPARPGGPPGAGRGPQPHEPGQGPADGAPAAPPPLRAAFPLAPPPPALREQVLREIALITAHQGFPRPRTPAAWITTVVTVVALIAGTVLFVQRNLERKPTTAIAFGPSSALSLSTTVIDLGATNSTATVTLANTGRQELAWNTSSGAGWLRVEPASGSLAGGKSQVLTVTADRAALPREGDARTQLKVTSADGQGEGNVTVALREERPPAIINPRASNTRIGGYGCPTVSEISAIVRDESPPLRVVLVGPGQHTQAMRVNGDTYTGRLGSGYGTNIVWRIIATDGRNNTATSPAGVIQHADCAARPAPRTTTTTAQPESSTRRTQPSRTSSSNDDERPSSGRRPPSGGDDDRDSPGRRDDGGLPGGRWPF
jgi:DNA-directed RNA polymerase specialized sigma24 family protein